MEAATTLAVRLPVALAEGARREGLEVPPGATVVLADALAAVGYDDPERIYWAARAVLVHDPAEIEAFDRGIGPLLGRPSPPRRRSAPPAEPVPVAVAVDDIGGVVDTDETDEPGERETLVAQFSAVEVLRTADLNGLTVAERLNHFLTTHW